MILATIITRHACDHAHNTIQLQFTSVLSAFVVILHLLLLAAYIRAKLHDNVGRSDFLSLMRFLCFFMDAAILFGATWVGLAFVFQKFIF